MYTILEVLSKSKNNPRKWIPIDPDTSIISDLFKDQRETILTLHNSVSDQTEYMDLETIRNTHLYSTSTLSNFVLSTGSNPLVTYTKDPNLQTFTAKYADAFRAGYKVDVVSQEGLLEEVRRYERTWIRLQKEGLDYRLFEKHCLTLVNGFLHFNEVDSNGIYIREGAKSNKVSGFSTVGIISFKDVSELKQIPITDSIIKRQGDSTLDFRAVLDVGESLGNKTILLSIGGYLCLPGEGTFRLESDTSIVVDFNNYSLLNRFFESYKYLDYSGYRFDIPDTNDEQYIVNELHSEEFIRYLLTMPQSFIVILDNPDITFEEDHLRPSPMPGIYTSYKDPLYPVIVGQGMLANYWYFYQKPYWSLNTIDGLRHRRQYNTNVTRDLLSVDDSREPFNPVNWSRAYYLKMYTERIVN